MEKTFWSLFLLLTQSSLKEKDDFKELDLYL